MTQLTPGGAEEGLVELRDGYSDNNIPPLLLYTVKHYKSMWPEVGYMYSRRKGKWVRKWSVGGQIKIPSSGTVKTEQVGLSKIYTVWLKITDKAWPQKGLQTFGYVHVQDHNVWNIAFNDADTSIFYLGAVVANNPPSPILGRERLWHVSIMSEKRRWVQQSAAEELWGFEISLRDQGMSWDPPS